MRLLLLALLPVVLLSCARSTPPPDTGSSQTPSADEAVPRYAIGDHDFMGISPGANTRSVLGSFADIIDPRPRQSGEGFEIYLLTADGQDLGYFLTEGPDATISAVVVLTRQARTTDGLGVGSTLDDIRALHPDVEVHGSEVESRVTTAVGSHLFQLDIYIARYDLQEGEVPGDTKVNQVWITQPPTAS